MMQTTPKPTRDGAAVYSPFVLSLYDIWVLAICNSFVWCCATTNIQLPFFKKFMGTRHLDIGLGTGYYPANAEIPENTQMTLMDLNPNSLNYTKERLGRPDTRTIQADVLQPLPLKGVYDSVSIFFLVHCLPGPVENKMALFTNLKPYLAENGKIYGTTVLGKDVSHNWFGWILMFLYNWQGIFSNWEDGEKEIREALCRDYMNVETRVVGRVLMFVASQPRLL